METSKETPAPLGTRTAQTCFLVFRQSLPCSSLCPVPPVLVGHHRQEPGSILSSPTLREVLQHQAQCVRSRWRGKSGQETTCCSLGPPELKKTTRSTEPRAEEGPRSTEHRASDGICDGHGGTPAWWGAAPRTTTKPRAAGLLPAATCTVPSPGCFLSLGQVSQLLLGTPRRLYSEE